MLATLTLTCSGMAGPPSLPTYVNLHYGLDNYRQVLDLYIPKDACGPLPVVIFVPGGGWVWGDKEHVAPYVDALLSRGFAGWLTSSQAIGYAEAARHLRGELGLEEAIALTEKRTKALARRQLAWFRRDPRIRWFEAGGTGAVSIVDDLTEYLRG